MKYSIGKVVEQIRLTSDIYSLVVEEREMAKAAVPGQFVNLYCNDGAKLLPRPISICEVDVIHGKIRFVYRVVGKGTADFSKLSEGSDIKMLGPLGNGFTLKNAPAILIGGGIGIPPMLELAKRLDCEKSIVLGYRDEVFLDRDLEQYGNVYIASEDGKHGVKGNVIDAIIENGVTGSVIYACGPLPMLRAIKDYAYEKGIEAQVSLEERMACGVGACLGCVCKTREVDKHSHVNNTRICKDGPVFLAEEVDF